MTKQKLFLQDATIKCLWTGFFFLSLNACHAPHRVPAAFDQSALPTHVTTTEVNRSQILKKLIDERVKVIEEGQFILVSIPSALLFPEHSPMITWTSYGILNDVACYMRLYRKIEVNVNAFEATNDSHGRMLALTRMRASAVGDYLVSQGIDSRIVFTRGMGNDKPIMKTDRKEAAYGNSRIEILFKNELV
jgi:intracellular multiplication protein IcmN